MLSHLRFIRELTIRKSKIIVITIFISLFTTNCKTIQVLLPSETFQEFLQLQNSFFTKKNILKQFLF